MLTFGVSSDMARLEPKKKCDGVGPCLFAIGKYKWREHMPATTECEHAVAEDRDLKMSVWVRR